MRTALILFAFALNLGATDYTVELDHWQALAEKGVPQAQYNLGLMYEAGRGMPKDLGQAADWYRKAAEQGIVEAQVNLALIDYEKDDVQDAEKWLKQAAEKGDAKAIIALADLYSDKIHNDAEARKWYEKASESGSAKAEFDIGVIFDLGKGVPADPAAAAKWYAKAAEKRYGPALTNIGILFYNGQGAKRDLVLAHEYFLLGSKAGDLRGTRLVEWTANKLSNKQLKRANELAEQWQSAHAGD